jgi:hypothetical protein
VIVPDFLVIGAYKSGTTALHHLLRSHPGLYLPARKEPNFFAFAGARPPFDHPAAASSVRDQSDYDALFVGARRGQLLGEVSPSYLAVPIARDRIRDAAPEVRLVAVLRNPVERAYSDFLMYRRDGLEREELFLRALEQQAERDPATDPTSHYIDTGRYADQIERYLDAFAREQLHVLLHEDLSDDHDATVGALLSFLGADPSVDLGRQAPSNVSGVPAGRAMRTAYALRRRAAGRLRPIVPDGLKRRLDHQLQQRLVREPMPAEARARLIEVYRADVRHLSALIGRDLTGWLDQG